MMKPNNSILFIALAFAACSIAGKTTKQSIKQVNEAPVSLNVDTLHPGIPAFGATAIAYHRDGKQVMTVQLLEPQIISVAAKPMKWGYFQFPHIERMPDNKVRVRW